MILDQWEFAGIIAVVVVVAMAVGFLLAHEVGVYHRARYGKPTGQVRLPADWTIKGRTPEEIEALLADLKRRAHP